MNDWVCVWCDRPIEKRDIGPTITGEPLLRWAPVDKRRRINCEHPKRGARYCIAAFKPVNREESKGGSD